MPRLQSLIAGVAAIGITVALLAAAGFLLKLLEPDTTQVGPNVIYVKTYQTQHCDEPAGSKENPATGAASCRSRARENAPPK